MPRPAPPSIVTQPATAHEAAAIAAAIERFRRDHAPPPTAPPERDPWRRAGLLESTGRDADARSPWGDGDPWH